MKCIKNNKIVMFVTGMVLLAATACSAYDRQAKIFDYKESRMRSELYDVMPLIQKGEHDGRIAKVHFSIHKHVFELEKFPKLIFKVKAGQPAKTVVQMREEDNVLQKIIGANDLNLLCAPHKEYLLITDKNQKRWFVTIEEKGDLAAFGAEGQQKIWDSLREAAQYDKQAAGYLQNLIAQLTVFTCLSCITDITLINFSFLKNGKIMVLDADQEAQCNVGYNKNSLASQSSVAKGLITLMFLIHEDYHDLIINCAAFMFHMTRENVMNCLRAYLYHSLEKKMIHVDHKNQSMDGFKNALKKAKSFHELRFSVMHILKDLDATTKSKSVKQFKDNAQEAIKTIFEVATSKPVTDTIKNIAFGH